MTFTSATTSEPAASGAGEPAQTPVKCCTQCHQTKPETDFAKKRGKRAAHCLVCNRVKIRAHYQANRQSYLDKAAQHNEAYRQRNHALVENALKGQRCSECKTDSDLTFYQGPGAEHQPVYMAANAGVSEAAVLDAIGRSVVVCRTCLGNYFIGNARAWRHASEQEREAAQREPVPEGHYKRYRAVSKT